MTVEVSVVVPTFNRPLLDRCLAGLVAQAFDPSAYEIVIADDAASDRTAIRSRIGGAGVCRRDRPSTTCRCGPARSAAARNAGWRFAQGG